MAKLRLTDFHPDNINPFASMGRASLHRHSDTEARFVERAGNGDVLVVMGHGLEYGGIFGPVITSGTITGLVEFDKHGHQLASISGADLDASELPKHFKDLWALNVAFRMLDGDDTVIGSKPDDVLRGNIGDDLLKGKGGNDDFYGNAGHDILAGGAGDDTFYFDRGDGADVITDFKKHGDHDTLISYHSSTYTAVQHGADTLVTFDNGASALLLDFNKADIQEGDILVF